MAAPAGGLHLPRIHVASASLFLLAFLALLPPRDAFKAHEFKKCDDSHFCKRNRGRASGKSALELTSGELNDGRFVGTVRNVEFAEASFSIEISAYEDGILRCKVEEAASERFRVPDVLEPDLEKKRIHLLRGTKPVSGDPKSTPLKFLHYDVEVKHNPVGLTVFENGVEVVQINGKGLFHFEHHRKEKVEGDEEGLWTETFRSHTDSKPKGPTAISLDVSFLGMENVYGIPERATRLALKPTRGPSVQSEPYRLYNLDVFEYEHESPFGLYVSVPFMQSHNAQRTVGFFWLNSAEMWIDVLAPGWDDSASDSKQVDTHWIAESGILDAFLFLGPKPKDVARQYSVVTGTTRMPQLFSIAYHQCRWNYKDEADVFNVDENFEKHDIPYDVLWLDIEHTDGKKYMTWDSSLFPNPIQMQNKFAAKGRHMVTIVDPHMKRDGGYELHKESEQKGYYVKDKNGNDFDGWCWPGSSSYLDMLSPKIRSWWATKFSYGTYQGSTPILHIWNDMNEPSVFNGPEVTMPKDNIHAGGVEHRDVHNAYGYYYHMASMEGLLKRDDGKKRPFVLSRAGFAGTQKLGAIWTGDNTADWNHLRISVPMVLSLGLAGIAFSGADVGGFFGNPDGELMTRWMQLGAFYPFFRAHAHLDTKRREPWLFGEPYTTHIREAIRLRYAFLPYVYTLFREANVHGVPVMRPLWMEFPEEEPSFTHDKCFMFGSHVLVCAVMEQGASSTEVYLPGKEKWYDIKSGLAYSPTDGRTMHLSVSLESVPAFLRAGSIVPRKDRARRSSSQMYYDPYTLIVALNSSLMAEGELYMDDGHSYDFEVGAFTHRKFTFSNGVLRSFKKMHTSPNAKEFDYPCLIERIVILGLVDPSSKLRYKRAVAETDNHEIEVEMGPAFIRPQAPFNALVLRSPNVKIKDDWSIRLLTS